MNYFRGEIQAGKKIKIRINSKRVTVLNIGAANIFIKFTNDQEDDGLLIPFNVLSRSFDFESPLEYVYIHSEKDTIIQVDGLQGGSIIAMPGVSSKAEPEEPTEPNEPAEMVASPYFPLPIPNADFDNWIVYDAALSYKVSFVNGLFETNDYGGFVNEGVYLPYDNNGFDFNWEEGYGGTGSSIYYGPGTKLLATYKPIKSSEDGSLVMPASKFGTWEDNKEVEGFYPKKYLSFPMHGFKNWIIFKSSDVTNLVFYNGDPDYSEGVFSSSEIGYKTYIFDSGVYTQSEENDQTVYESNFSEGDLLETSTDIKGSDFETIKERTLLRVI